MTNRNWAKTAIKMLAIGAVLVACPGRVFASTDILCSTRPTGQCNGGVCDDNTKNCQKVSVPGSTKPVCACK